MDLERADGLLARAFERELQRRHGRIGATEIALGYARGHFRRLFREQRPIKLDVVLRALGLLGVDPREFIAQAYDIDLRPEHLLSLHARPGRLDPQLPRIEKALKRLETGDPPAPARRQARDYRPRLETYWCAGAAYQRKYLGTTRMFRQAAFVTDYLELLDDLCYEQPRDAAKVAAGVVTILLPLIPAGREQILNFACRAIGVYASGHRRSLGFETAATALVAGLRLAGRHGLKLARAELLQRGAFVLSDHGEFHRALSLLEKAEIIYSDHGCAAGVGKAVADRAAMYGHLDDHQKALFLFRRALRELPPDLTRWRVAARDGVITSCRELGDLESAEKCLRDALEAHGPTEDVTRGKIVWQAAAIAFGQGDLSRSERIVARTRAIFEDQGAPTLAALAWLDHASVLMAQGKREEACQLATSMASLLKPFENDESAGGAIMELHRAGMDGSLTQELIDQAAEKIEPGGSETGHALFKAALAARRDACG